MFNKFIVVTDLTGDTPWLFGCTKRLMAYGAEKCLMIQYENIDEVIRYSRLQSSTLLKKSEEIFAAHKNNLLENGFEVQTRVVAGSPTKEINDIAVSEEYSLIVVGAGRLSSEGKIYFSSLANDLMHVVTKPFIIMRPRKTDTIKEDNTLIIDGCEVADHILCPTDFSNNADIAFRNVLEIAPGKAKKVTLLHVQDSSKINPHLEDRVEDFNNIDIARLEGMKKILLDKGNIEVDVVVKYGSPALEIIKAVDELDAQLVIMGSQGRGYIEEFFLGSVSANVARNASCSVLLIPTKKQ